MAKIRGGFFANGDFSGGVGDFVVKTRDGVIYLSHKPRWYHMSMKPEEVTKRNKFSINGKLGGVLNKNPYLFQAWAKCNVKAKQPMNRMNKINFDLCAENRLTAKNVITPPDGFQLNVSSVELSPEKVIIELQPVELIQEEIKVKYLLYFYFYDPLNPISDYYKYMPLNNYTMEGSRLTFNLDVREKFTAGKYYNYVMFFCAITLNANDEVQRYSATFGTESEESEENEMPEEENIPKEENPKIISREPQPVNECVLQESTVVPSLVGNYK